MSNEPKMAPQAPASDPAKSTTETKPAAIVTPAPAVAPVDSKKV